MMTIRTKLFIVLVILNLLDAIFTHYFISQTDNSIETNLLYAPLLVNFGVSSIYLFKAMVLSVFGFVREHVNYYLYTLVLIPYICIVAGSLYTLIITI